MERVTAQVTITLTIDEEHLEQQRRETALFHRAYEVYRDLKTLFPHLETTKVAKRPDGPLTVFRDAFFRPVPAEMTQPVSALEIWECSDRDGEIDSVARKIAALCHQGYRYRDFLVLARTSDLYHDRVERIFRRYGIPCFSDYRRPMTSHPAAEAISALFGVFRSRWSHESIFRLLKTDLFPREPPRCRRFGKLLSGLRYPGPPLAAGWRMDLWAPAGTATGRGRTGRSLLAAHQRHPPARAGYPLPLLERSPGIPLPARLVYPVVSMAVPLGIPDALRQWQEEDEQSGLAEEGKEHEQVWKRIGTFLNEIVSLCSDDETDLDEFSRIVEDGLGSLKFSLIPPTLDHVTLTAVERGYTMQAKVVFLCGVNDGIFPQHSQEEGLFSDKERHRLADLGIVLGPGSRFRSFQERFLFYLGATRASERFVVSYVVADDDGSALEKASWIHQLCDKAIQRHHPQRYEVPPGQEAEYLLALPAALD